MLTKDQTLAGLTRAVYAVVARNQANTAKMLRHSLRRGWRSPSVSRRLTAMCCGRAAARLNSLMHIEWPTAWLGRQFRTRGILQDLMQLQNIRPKVSVFRQCA